MLGFGGLGPRPVGTAAMVANELEKWMQGGDIDGFNLNAVSNPESWEDVVQLLIPELQRRGLYWTEYPAHTESGCGTLRENAYCTPGEPMLRADHPGSQFKWALESVA